MTDLNKKDIIYAIYFIIVLISFAISTNIVPIAMQTILIFIYCISMAAVVCYFFYLDGFRMRKVEVFLYSMILVFCFFCMTSSIYNFGSFSVTPVIYFFSFVFIYKAVSSYGIIVGLKPFFMCAIIIFILSIVVLLGFEPTFYLRDSIALNGYLDSSQTGRLIGFSGVYLSQNQLGAHLIILVSVFMIKLLANSNHKIAGVSKENALLMMMLIVSVFFVILTNSRATLLAVTIVIVIPILKGLRNIKLIVGVVFATSLLFVIVYQYMYIFENLLGRVGADGLSTRDEIWENALDLFMDNIMLGMGSYKYVTASGSELSAHNAYINQLVSTGMISMACWGVAIIYVLIKAFKIIIFYDYKYHAVDLCLAAVFCAILAHQAFETIIFSGLHPLTLFIFYSLSALMQKDYKRKSPK